MMKKKNLLLGLLLSLLATAAVSGCHAEEFRSFTIGLSTPAGNHIYVQRVVFDNEWWAAGGILKCCWEQSRAATLVFERPMPHEALVRWRQEDSGVNYEAAVRLDKDLPKLARDLPGYTRISDGRKFRDSPCLIVGMRPDGKVFIWLTNARSENNIQGRVLHVVGEAQAVEVPAVSTE